MLGLIFTYALAYGGAIVALFRPYSGLLVYVIFAILTPEKLWHWSVPAGNYSRIIAIALLVGWGIHGFGSWQLGKATPVITCLVSFFAWLTISALLAPNRVVAFAAVESMFKIVVPVFVGITLIDSRAKVEQLVWVIVLSLGYLGYGQNMTYLRLGGAVHRDNFVAHQFTIGATAALGLLLYARAFWQKGVFAICFVLTAHVPFIHQSRGAMLGLVSSAVVAFLFLRKRPSHFALFGLALLVGIAMAGKEVQERFSTTFASGEERDGSAQSRIDLWKNLSNEIGKNPFFGIGPDHWPLIAHTYGWPPGKEGHNVWIQMTAEIGLIGGWLFLGQYLLCIALLGRIALGRRKEPPRWGEGFAVIIIASLAGYIVEQVFGSFETMEVPYYLNLVGAGVLKLESSENPDTHSHT